MSHSLNFLKSGYIGDYVLQGLLTGYLGVSTIAHCQGEFNAASCYVSTRSRRRINTLPL